MPCDSMYIKFKHTKNESVYEKSEEQLPLEMGRLWDTRGAS